MREFFANGQSYDNSPEANRRRRAQGVDIYGNKRGTNMPGRLIDFGNSWKPNMARENEFKPAVMPRPVNRRWNQSRRWNMESAQPYGTPGSNREQNFMAGLRNFRRRPRPGMPGAAPVAPAAAAPGTPVSPASTTTPPSAPLPAPDFSNMPPQTPLQGGPAGMRYGSLRGRGMSGMRARAFGRGFGPGGAPFGPGMAGRPMNRVGQPPFPGPGIRRPGMMPFRRRPIGLQAMAPQPMAPTPAAPQQDPNQPV